MQSQQQVSRPVTKEQLDKAKKLNEIKQQAVKDKKTVVK